MSNNINNIKNSENALTANMNSKELSALEKIQDYAFNSYKDVAWKNPKLEEINNLSVDDKIHKIINDNIKMLNENTINDKSSMKNVAESIMQQIRKASPEIETAIDNEVNRDYKKYKKEYKKEYNKKRIANKNEIKQSIKNAALGAKLRDILIKATTTLMTEVQTKKATETINQIEFIEQTKKQQEKEMKKIAKEETAKFLKKKQWYDRKTKLEKLQKQTISAIKRIEESQAFNGCNTILHIAKKQMPAYKIKNTIKKIPKIINLSFANEFLKSNEDRIKALNSGNKIDAQAIVVSLQRKIAQHMKAINTIKGTEHSDEAINKLSYIYLIEMSNNFIKNRKQKLAQLKNRLNKITSLMKVTDNNIQLLETQNQNTTSVKPKASIGPRDVIQYPKEKKPMKMETKIKLTNQIKNKGIK